MLFCFLFFFSFFLSKYPRTCISGFTSFSQPPPTPSPPALNTNGKHGCLRCTCAEVEVLLYVHRNCRLIRDGSPGRPPRLSHSSWALRYYSSMLLYVHGDHKAYKGREPRTATSTLTQYLGSDVSVSQALSWRSQTCYWTINWSEESDDAEETAKQFCVS